MTRRELLLSAGSAVVAAGVAGGTAAVMQDPVPPQPAPEPPPPQSGVIDQIGLPVPGGAGSPLWLIGSNGAGGRWSATIRAWDAGAQLTYNGVAERPEEVIRMIAIFRTNVIWWPLPELDGAALRADFTQMQ